MPKAPPLFTPFKRGPEHERERKRLVDRRRSEKPEREWLKDLRWKKRRELLRLANPHCVDCAAEGVLTPWTHADHDPPHNGDEHAFFNGPIVGRCQHHHNKMTAMYDGGFGNPKKPRPKAR